MKKMSETNNVIEMRYINHVFIAFRERDSIAMMSCAKYNAFSFDLAQAISELKQ